MIIRQADVIESIHTGNTFVVEYVSEDGNFFILHPKDGEKSRGYNIHELNRSFVKVPHVPLANEGDMTQPQNEPQNIPNNIPGDLSAAVNRLLDCDGTRGHFSAIRCSDAREEVERLLAQPVSSGYTFNSPEIPDGWKLVPVEPTTEMINAALASGALSIRTAYRVMLAAAPEGGNDNDTRR